MDCDAGTEPRWAVTLVLLKKNAAALNDDDARVGAAAHVDEQGGRIYISYGVSFDAER